MDTPPVSTYSYVTHLDPAKFISAIVVRKADQMPINRYKE